MNFFLLLISCCGLSVRAQIVNGSSQGLFFDCLSSRCIAEPGVHCLINLCRCPRGQIGNPKIQCADTDDNCLCQMGGDPHLTTNGGLKSRLGLNCAHKITDQIIETPDVPSGCVVRIVGLAINSTNYDPMISFESQIDVEVTAGSSRYTARIIRDQDAVTQFVGGANPDFLVNETKETGLLFIDIPKCGLTIRYQSDGGLFSLLTPAEDTMANSGICGPCAIGQYEERKQNESEALRDLLNSLTIQSPIDGSDINQDRLCTRITTAAATCTSDRFQYVTRFCGPWLDPDGFGSCIAGFLGEPVLGHNFLDCVKFVCFQRKCKSFETFVNACPYPEGSALLSDPQFCT